jgi:Ankyrin repeats (3 copies)
MQQPQSSSAATNDDRRRCYNDAGASEENMNNNADGSESNNHTDDEEEDDLAAILATMDIDKDFNNWTSFRSSVVSYNSSNRTTSVASDAASAAAAAAAAPRVGGSENRPLPGGADPSTDEINPDLGTLRARLARLEIFSRHYRPTPEEAQEVTDLAAFLGVGRSSKTFLGGLFGGGKNSKKSLVPQDSSPGAAAISSASPSNDRERFESIQERSVLLFRAFALLDIRAGGGTSASSSAIVDSKDVEVMLLTRGLVVADVKRRSSKRNVLLRSFLACVTWDQVDHVVEGIGRDAITSWELHFKSGRASDPSLKSASTVWTFTTASSKERAAWLDALETVLVRTHMHSGTTTATASSPRIAGRKTLDPQHRLGWQYTLVHRGGYTAAVTGVLDRLQVPVQSVNACDPYNGLTMLIYAVRSGNSNVVSHLLDPCLADVDATDRDGHTAMYYATRDQQHDMQQILAEHGAMMSLEAVQCGCGELFGAVSDAQEVVDDRRDREVRQAREAQTQMNDNLRLMQERGTKIREMGDKATQLNEGAANYADMARQLKEKSQKPTFFGLL